MLDILYLTMLAQIAAYFALLYILNKLLYQPVFNILEKRKERTEGTIEDAESMEKEAREGVEGYKERLKQETVKAQEARQVIKKEAVEKEKRIIESAREKAQEEIARLRGELEKSRLAALEELKKEAGGLSKSIAEKVLDRPLSSVVMLLGALASALVVPALAMASGSSGEGAEGHDPMPTVWKVLNFLVLAGGVYYIWKRWLKGMLEARGSAIQDAIEAAERTKKEAEVRLGEYKEKLKLLDTKVEQIHSELRLEAAEEKKRIIEEAERTTAKLGEQAAKAAEQELKKAKAELKDEVARLAVSMAEEVLKKNLKTEDQKRLVTEFVDKISLS